MIDHRDGASRKDDALGLHETRRAAYLLLARRALLKTLLDRGTATADDVRARVTLPDGVDPVCLGAVPTTLARAKIIRRAGFAPSGRPEAHARPVSQWELADAPAAVAWLAANPEPPVEGGRGQRTLWAA